MSFFNIYCQVKYGDRLQNQVLVPITSLDNTMEEIKIKAVEKMCKKEGYNFENWEHEEYKIGIHGRDCKPTDTVSQYMYYPFLELKAKHGSV